MIPRASQYCVLCVLCVLCVVCIVCCVYCVLCVLFVVCIVCCVLCVLCIVCIVCCVYCVCQTKPNQTTEGKNVYTYGEVLVHALGEVAPVAVFADLVAHDHERILTAALRSNQSVMHLHSQCNELI